MSLRPPFKPRDWRVIASATAASALGVTTLAAVWTTDDPAPVESIALTDERSVAEVVTVTPLPSPSTPSAVIPTIPTISTTPTATPAPVGDPAPSGHGEPAPSSQEAVNPSDRPSDGSTTGASETTDPAVPSDDLDTPFDEVPDEDDDDSISLEVVAPTAVTVTVQSTATPQSIEDPDGQDDGHDDQDGQEGPDDSNSGEEHEGETEAD